MENKRILNAEVSQFKHMILDLYFLEQIKEFAEERKCQALEGDQKAQNTAPRHKKF